MSSIEENEPITDWEISSNGTKREVGEIIEEEDYCASCMKINFLHLKQDRCLNSSDKLKKNCLVCEHCKYSGLRSLYKLKKHYIRHHRTTFTKSIKKRTVFKDISLVDYQQAKNYSTRIGVIDELRMNKPSNLKTYTKKKIPVQIIKEEPEFIVSD